MTRMATGLMAAGVIATVALARPALAAGPYDGTWVVDVPAADYIAQAGDYRCPALRLPIQIQNNQVTGKLERVASATGAVIVEAGQSARAEPVRGSVQPDGTVTAQWEMYQASGRLGQDTGMVTIRGECGPRSATAVRITSASAGGPPAGASGSSAQPSPGR
jgi:hypothetical protein